jgi:dsDNA-specific endonuclease/ATPase MutS2
MAKGVLDLHGMTEEEAMNAIDRFLTASQNQNLPKITIITGKGTGKLKALLTKILKGGGFPFHPEKLANGKVNEGSFTVYLG